VGARKEFARLMKRAGETLTSVLNGNHEISPITKTEGMGDARNPASCWLLRGHSDAYSDDEI
jgi:hypothetical protein